MTILYDRYYHVSFHIFFCSSFFLLVSYFLSICLSVWICTLFFSLSLNVVPTSIPVISYLVQYPILLCTLVSVRLNEDEPFFLCCTRRDTHSTLLRAFWVCVSCRRKSIFNSSRITSCYPTHAKQQTIESTQKKNERKKGKAKAKAHKGLVGVFLCCVVCCMAWCGVKMKGIVWLNQTRSKYTYIHSLTHSLKFFFSVAI